MKERTEINSINTVIIFEDDFTDEDLAIIPKDFKGDIVVNDDVILNNQKSSCIPCNLWVEEYIHSGEILIKGDLFVRRKIHCSSIKVEGNCYCGANIQCDGDINVEGDIFCTKRIYCNNMKVAGDCLCERDIQSMGDITIAGDLETKGILTVYNNVEVLGDITANAFYPTVGCSIKAKRLKVERLDDQFKIIIGDF